jgi:hypothetical protein
MHATVHPTVHPRPHILLRHRRLGAHVAPLLMHHASISAPVSRTSKLLPMLCVSYAAAVHLLLGLGIERVKGLGIRV